MEQLNQLAGMQKLGAALGQGVALGQYEAKSPLPDFAMGVGAPQVSRESNVLNRLAGLEAEVKEFKQAVARAFDELTERVRRLESTLGV